MRFCFRFAGATLLLSGLLMGGCATPPARLPALKPFPAADAPVIGPGLDPATERLAEAHAHYAAGVVHDMNDEPAAALQEYYQAALDDLTNEALTVQVADRLIRRKKFEEAQQLLSAATARPAAPGLLFARLGMVEAQLGHTHQAISADKTAIQRAPGELAGYQNLCLSYLQNHQPDEAVKVLDAAARQKQVDADFLIGLGELYASYLKQQPAKKAAVRPRAVAVLERARRLDSSDAQDMSKALLELRLADALNALGEQDQAAQLYLGLLKKLPDVPFVRQRLHTKLADIYLRGSDRQRAAEQLRAIVHDDPTNPMAYYYLGYLAYENKQSAEAAENFARTVMLSPDFEDAYYELALTQMNLNQTAAALQTLEKARAKFKDNFVLEFYTGLAYSRQKSYRDALHHFTAAEVIAKATDPKRADQDLYFQLGACSERLGDYTQAEAYFQKCLQLAPDFAEALNYLGYMWAEHGLKLEQARALIEKALKAEPKNPAYLDSFGWVLFKLNQPQAALEQERKAVELSPEPDATLYDHLGDIYSALQQIQKAKEAWGKSLAVEPNDVIRKKLQDAH